MRKILLVPSGDLTAIDADKIAHVLRELNIECVFCRSYTDVTRDIDLVLIVLGNSNNPRLTAPVGHASRELQISIAYMSLPCSNMAQCLEEILSIE